MAKKKTVKRRKRVSARSIGLTATETADLKDAASASLASRIAEDGGAVLASYREPFGGTPAVLAALPPVDAVAVPMFLTSACWSMVTSDRLPVTMATLFWVIVVLVTSTMLSPSLRMPAPLPSAETLARRQNHGGELVFAGDDGEPLHPGNVSRRFRHLVATTDVPRIRLHDLRHTCAALLIAAGPLLGAGRGVRCRLRHARCAFLCRPQ